MAKLETRRWVRGRKGHKNIAIVDHHSLRPSVSTRAANRHKVRLVQLRFDFYVIEAELKTLIGDRAYDSDPQDDDSREDAVETITPPNRIIGISPRKMVVEFGDIRAAGWPSGPWPGFNGSAAFSCTESIV